MAMVCTMNFIMGIYNDILSHIQFSLEFKQVKTFVSYYLLLILHKTQKSHLHFGNHSRIRDLKE